MEYLLLPLLILAEFVYIKIASKLGIEDIPNFRSSHNKSVVRGGGIIFILAVIMFSFYNGGYPFFLFGLILVGVVSFVDDIHPLSPKFRLVIQILSVLVMFKDVGLPTCLLVLLIPMTVVSVYILNVYNFMDGINGMTGMYSLVVLSSFWLLNRHNNYVNATLIEYLLVSIMVFGFFNFRKRSLCFAGDVGSVGLGYCVLFIMLKAILGTHEPKYLIFGIVYGIDVSMTLIHRILLHENIFLPHRMFLFQLLANEAHIPHLMVSASYALLQLAVSLGFVFLPINKRLYFTLMVVILVTVYFLLVKKLFPRHLDYLRKQS